jgi:4-cresol dehydrogenase (hydroxylating) flavoprotein subunit
VATQPLSRSRDFSADALSSWSAVVGSNHVYTDEATLAQQRANVSGFERAVRALVCPATTEEVQAIVRIARRHRVPLYPLSTGKNWGLGSRLPVEGGAALVDLGRMTRIRHVDASALHAEVEAGVTQRRLHEAIRGLPVRMNVTGSSADTSILGNALERGIGYFGLRAEETWNLEVVLGTGEILRTGFGHRADSVLAPLYRHGIGPSLDGLFFQSNFGIVTAASVALRPEPASHAAAVVSIDDEADLPRLVEALARARREGVYDGVVHVGDRSRTRITMAPLVAASLADSTGLTMEEAHRVAVDILERQGFGAWSGLVGISGTPQHVREGIRTIRRLVSGFARVRIITDARLALARRLLAWLRPFAAAKRTSALLDAVTPLYGLTKGIPSDAAVASVGYAAGRTASSNPDHGDAGMLYCLPLMPLTGEAATEALALIRSAGSRFGIETSITFNVLDARVLEAVVTIPFSRSDSAHAERAASCSNSLRGEFIARGFTPYRVDIGAMRDIVRAGDPFWETARAIKDVLDPDHILSRGRYSL